MTGMFWRKLPLVSATIVSGAFAISQTAIAQVGAADDNTNRDVIIVTAQKRAQSLDDVSAAVSALEGEGLADRQIFTLEGIQVVVPGITIGNDFAFAKVYVRGIGLNSALAGLDPSVALHVDGAVISQASQQFTSLFDLERVEVIRGPQGTLYGRNATGGSVNLITAKPTDELEAFANLTIGGGDFNIIAEGGISGPISDTIQGRIAFRHQNRNGFGTHTGTGTDIDNANKLGIRGQLNFDLSDRLSNLVLVEYYEEDENSKAFKFFGPSFSEEVIDGLIADGAAALLDPDPAINAALAAQIPNLVSLAGEDALLNSRDLGGDLVPVGDLETVNITNTLNFQISDWLAIRSITNYRAGESVLQQDFDISNLVNGIETSDPSTVQGQITENEQFSQEIQFLIDRGRWRGIVGGYYFDEEVLSTVPIGTNPLAAFNTFDSRTLLDSELGQLLPDARVIIPGDLNVEAFALFANFTFDITNNFRLKIGGRQSWEERDIVVLTRLPGPGITLLVPNQDARDYADFSPEAGVEFDWGNSLFYFTYSQGFKSGGAALVDATPFLIDEEEIENFELGLKGSYFGGALNLAVAGFVYTIDNAQFDRTNLTAGGARFSTSVENAASTNGKGIEVEGIWRPTRNFRFDFNGTYYDIAFDEFITTNPIEPFGALEGLAGLPVREVNLAGNRPRNTPEFTFGVRGTYTHSLNGAGDLDWSVGYAYKGDQFFTEFNDERLSADEYGILDANIKYSFPGSNMSINVWGRNLTDEFVAAGAFAVATSRTIGGTFLPPRQYGVTLSYEF